MEPFSRFHDQTQFEILANSLAERTAHEVVRYRELFPNVHEVCAHYRRHRGHTFWQSFHAAVACALAGQADHARRFLKQVTDSEDDGRDWVVSAQAEARQLSVIAGGYRTIPACSDRKGSTVARTPETTCVGIAQL